MMRTDGSEARHVAVALTYVVCVDIIDHVLAVEHLAPSHRSVTRDPAAHWPAALLCVAVWANGVATLGDARMWLWASKQTWFRPDCVSDEQVELIVAAAERVIAASPEWRPVRDRHAGKDRNDSQSGAEAIDADETDPLDGSDACADALESGCDLQRSAANEGEDARVAENLDNTCDSGTGNPPQLTIVEFRQVGENLRRALEAAAPAARGVLDDVTIDRPPAADDLSALAELRESFDEASAVLREAGAVVNGDTGAALLTALDDLVMAADDTPTRTSLARLRGLVAPADNAPLIADLAKAQELADDLIATPRWTNEERTRAVTLATLNDLANPETPAAQRFALINQFVNCCRDLLPLTVQANLLTRCSNVNVTAEGADELTESAPSVSVAAEPGTNVDGAGMDVPTPSAEGSAVGAVDDHHGAQITDSAPSGEADAESDPESEPVRAVDTAATIGDADTDPHADHEPDPVTETGPVVVDDGADDRRLVENVATLIGQRRFGLAATMAAEAGWIPRSAVLRIAALSEVVRTETGAVNNALRTELADLDATAVADDSPSALLTVASLVRAALVTGESTTGAWLTELAPRVVPDLRDVAEQVGRRALQGLLVGSPPLTVLHDVTEAERSLREACEAAGRMLRRRTLRFKRATDIAKTWLAPDGLLGRPLKIAAADGRTAVRDVIRVIRRLSDNSQVSREIEELDRKFRGASGKPVEGASRQDLVNLIQETVQTLTGWTDLVLALQRSNTPQQWSTVEVTQMTTALRERRRSVLNALEAQSENSDPLLAAASRAAATSLTLTFDLLEGEARLAAGEPAPAFALTAELLKVPGADVDTALSRVATPTGTTLCDLFTAAHRSWNDALTAQIEAENFGTAKFLVAADLLPGGSRFPVTANEAVSAAEKAVQTQLKDLHEQLSADLLRARTNNEISDEQAGELTGLLNDADPSATSKLCEVRSKLDHVGDLLPHYRAESARRLSERLSAVPGVAVDTVSRVTGLIKSGHLRTAEELVYFLEIGEPVPTVNQREDLQQFFPAVPDALPRAATRDIIEAVRGCGKVPGCDLLDFGELSPNLANLAADALENWRKLATTPPESRLKINERELLLPALRLVGIEAKHVHRLDDLPRGRDRRFVDVSGITINGKALVPAFGSKLGGRLRVLLAWGRPSAQLLLSHADHSSAESLLIAYFGTMSAQNRQELAQQIVGNNRTAPVIVLDDAALTYLAARGNRQMDATMRILLPFSNTNPYVSKKRGLVAEEMFYGRDQERKGVIDPDGTQILYGGRGLGKSALLRNAAAVFESQGSPGERVSVYLSLDTVVIRAGSAIGQADTVWAALLPLLTDHEIIVTARSSRRQKPHEQVRAGVLEWLGSNPQRRLLILLDEADCFFESDAPEFVETKRLKELGQSTDGRIKVVFAGLHSVQRYAKSARNGPFSHLAQRPTVIGPLRPQFATNLLTRPLGALGYRFADDDLVNRVLGYCSYQPFLLQMFGSKLVDTMQAWREKGVGGGEPPYVITLADVVAVENRAELKADISAAFHDTLRLDSRYDVIANVLAHYAHESGLDSRISDVDLRQECLSWWPAGFVSLDVEGFRAYLQEMVGLGVLAPNNDGRGWHLRSSNVLQMIGSKDDVMGQLVDAEKHSVQEEFIALEMRQRLSDGRRSPLTGAQIDDVLGDHANQVRVVLGSPATGIGDVDDAVRFVGQIGDQFVIPQIKRQRQFTDELVAGLPGQRRVVLTDLVARAPRAESCSEALDAALKLRPRRAGVTRSAVIVAGPLQMPLWRRVLGNSDRDPALGTVTLRRYDLRTLRVWAQASDKFRVSERLEKLFNVTGGWPALVEHAGRFASTMEEEDALAAITSELASSVGAARFVDSVGIAADDELVRAFDAVVSLTDDSGMTFAEVVDAAGCAIGDAYAAAECLRALAVFDVDQGGRYRPDPVLVRCWPHRMPTLRWHHDEEADIAE